MKLRGKEEEEKKCVHSNIHENKRTQPEISAEPYTFSMFEMTIGEAHYNAL